MEHQKKYLLENTPEAKQQIENIIKLFKTTEEASIKLALQLLETGGVPDKVWTYLIAILWTNELGFEEEKVIEEFMEKYAPSDFQNQIKLIYEEGFEYNNDNFTKLFEDENYPFPEIIDKTELANQILLLRGYENETIAKYCLTHRTISPKKILGVCLTNDYLNLSGLDLEYLPKEIAEFHNITRLNLVGNNFSDVSDIPDEIVALQKLRYIYGIDFLNESIILKLKNYFPKVFARKKLEEADYLKHNENYKRALVEVNESLSLDSSHENAHAWYLKGFILHKLEQFEEELDIIFQALEIPNLDKLWKSRLYFRKGQGYFYLEQFEKAEEAYDEALALNPKYATAIYNKACVYAKWQQKVKLLNFLEQAIKLDRKFIKVAQEDTDFKEYWEDENFKALLSQ